MPLKQQFGSVLQRLRQERGFSQEELGFESGYHRTYISQLERGRKNPSLETLFKLASALGVAPSEIVRQVEIDAGEVFQQTKGEGGA